VNALKLAALLTLDGSRFKAGLKEAEVAADRHSANISKQFKNRLGGMFGTAALGFGIKSLIDYNSQIKDTADRLGISTKALQEQQYWVTQNGGSLEDLSAAYRGLAKARAAALGGDDKKMGIFEALGIDKAALAGEQLESIFARASEAFRTTDFGADKIAAVMEVFGKGGASIIPALSQSLEESAAAARELGQVIDKDVNAHLEEMGDILARLKANGLNIGSNILSTVVKGVDMGATGLLQGAIGLGQQGLRAAGGALGMVSGGNFKGIRNWLWAQDQALGDTSNDLFESMLNRYDPAKIEERRKKAPAIFEDEESPEKETAVREAMERLSFDRTALPDVPASQVSGLTSSGQLSGRSFAYSNKEQEREIELARQTLKVEQEQLKRLDEIARQRSKTLRVNP
jgi:hypothetical protein